MSKPDEEGRERESARVRCMHEGVCARGYGHQIKCIATRHARHRQRRACAQRVRQQPATVELMYDLVSNSVVLCREEVARLCTAKLVQHRGLGRLTESSE